MHKIVIGNHTCLHLDHQGLIDTLYKRYIRSEDIHYTLKSEIFNFKPKDVDCVETTNPPKNRRKRKAETENEECEEIKSLIHPFLKEFQIVTRAKNLNLENLPRFWEEIAEFPQFRGANATTEFQTTTFQQETYIIPPKSTFYNYNVGQMPEILPELGSFDVIIMDMPWQNKYIKRLKKVKQSLAYKMLDNDSLKKIPMPELIHQRTLVALWCTNARQHRKAIEEEFLPAWNLKLWHTLKWFKLNTQGELISTVKAEGYKQPYELLYIACHKERHHGDLKGIQEVDMIASIPSIIHSHKPPIIEWLKEYLDDSQQFNGLEIFARYLQPHFTSIGLEVLKLMDKRLYNKYE